MTKHKVLQNRLVRSVLSLILAALMIGTISYLGITTYKASHAASGASLYVTPDSANVGPGSTLSVTIREDSGSEQVNSVQASLSYDATKLQYVSLTESGNFPVAAATSTNTAGVVRIGRGTSEGSVSGDKAVVTVNFKVVGTSGSGAVGFEKGFSFLVRSSDSKDILQNIGSGSYAISGASSTAAKTTKPILVLSPSSGNYAPGSVIPVVVRLNSYDTAVTTVEAAIGYPASQLQYVGVNEGTTYTTKQRTNTNNGVIDVIRAVPGGGDGVKGDKQVVTINFKVVGTSGAAALTIAGASAAFDTTGSGVNVLNLPGSTGTSYSIGASGSTSTSPQPVSATDTAGSETAADSDQFEFITTPSQALTAGFEEGDGWASLTEEEGETMTELGGEVSLEPIVDPQILIDNPNATVKKVEFFIDGKLIATQTTSPYTYKFDTRQMRNGTYLMVVKTYLSTGTVDTRAEKLLVKNKVTVSYVMRHFLANTLGLIAILSVLAVLVLKLVIPRFSRSPEPAPAASTDHDIMYGFTAPPTTPGPVASDPTVIAPLSGLAGPQPVVSAPPSAAQTTQALPMTPVAPLQAATPAQTPVVQPTVIQPTLQPRLASVVSDFTNQPTVQPHTPAPAVQQPVIQGIAANQPSYSNPNTTTQYDTPASPVARGPLSQPSSPPTNRFQIKY